MGKMWRQTFMKTVLFTRKWVGIKETNKGWLKHSEAAITGSREQPHVWRGRGMEGSLRLGEERDLKLTFSIGMYPCLWLKNKYLDLSTLPSLLPIFYIWKFSIQWVGSSEPSTDVHLHVSYVSIYIYIYKHLEQYLEYSIHSVNISSFLLPSLPLSHTS